MHVSPVGGAAGDGEVGRVRREDADHRADYDAPVKSHVGLRTHGGSAPLASVAQRSAALFSVLPAAHMRSVALLCPALCDPWTVATRTVAIHGL